MSSFAFFFPNRIIGIVDTVAFKLVLVKQNESLLAEDVAISVAAADGTNFQETCFSISDSNNVRVCDADNPITYIHIIQVQVFFQLKSIIQLPTNDT